MGMGSISQHSGGHMDPLMELMRAQMKLVSAMTGVVLITANHTIDKEKARARAGAVGGKFMSCEGRVFIICPCLSYRSVECRP